VGYLHLHWMLLLLLLLLLGPTAGRGKTFLCNKLKCYLNW
jgi:hypothetical protein